jgi:hypothetical protein
MRKLDNMLRHPTDGSQWRKVDRTFPTFADDARNIRFGLSMEVHYAAGAYPWLETTW